MILHRRQLLWGMLLAGTAPLAACGGKPPPPPPPPPPPTLAILTLKAGADVNPDDSGQPKPIAVRVFELGDTGAFMATDFFALDKDAKAALDGDLLSEVGYVLRPGGIEIWQRRLKPETRYIGVVAAYSQIDGAEWRAVFTPPPNQTTLMEADLGARGVQLVPVKP